MKRLSVLLFAILWSTLSYATASESTTDVWVPRVHFQFENASYKDTLYWISGFGYALYAAAQEARKNGEATTYCLPKRGYIGSRPLLRILNTEYRGQTITAEQATAALIRGVEKAFPCRCPN